MVNQEVTKTVSRQLPRQMDKLRQTLGVFQEETNLDCKIREK